MRTVPPITGKTYPNFKRGKPAREFILNFTIPFTLFKKKYFIRLLAGRDLGREAVNSASGNRWLNTIITLLVVLVLLLTIMAGIFFLLYLAKTLLGIDIFPNSHVLDWWRFFN